MRPELLEIIGDLRKIRLSMLELAASVDISQFGERADSARNLLHYIALRRQDIRVIQERLYQMGISSMGRSESHVLYNLDSVIRILQGLANEPGSLEPDATGVSSLQGRAILERNSDVLFGPRQAGRTVRTMATMPSQAAVDYLLVRDLVAAGMDCMRINCAHDNQTAWLGMIEFLRRAEKEVGRKCKVLMDIAGPKLRTGKLKPGPQVLRLRPERDAFGRVTSPARAFLSAAGDKSPATSNPQVPVLEVQKEWLGELRSGDVIHLLDSRGSKRFFKVLAIRGKTAKVESRKTIYLDPTTRLAFSRGTTDYTTKVTNIPFKANPIILRKGDKLVVTASQIPGKPAVGRSPGRVPCTLPEALRFVKPGERIWFDDGKIGGIVKSASASSLEVEVINAVEEGAKLGEDKGINLPDTAMKLPPLTQKDKNDLRFITEHADMVGYSFVRDPEDLRALRSELAMLGREGMGTIIKVETLKAFEQLPTLLLESLRGPASGVMIARGDLAVECGYERLAEVQEEILWLSEAAHMPTIWATQVLEGLTKNGIPSRAEVTDAAMGGRSECVMLNKGPHLVEAIRALDNILRRMQAHQVKKQSLMRQLNIASSFLKAISAP